MRLVHQLLLLIASTSSCILLVAAQQEQTYAVDWSAVPSTAPATRPIVYNNEFAGCMCDLSAQCDRNCCCDPDCSEEAKSIFKEQNMCSQERTANNDLDYCYEPNAATELQYTNNLPEYASREPRARAATCIVFRRLPDEDIVDWMRPPTQPNLNLQNEPWPTKTVPEGFKTGERVPFIATTTSGTSTHSFALRGDGYWKVPYPKSSAGGACTDDRALRYLESERETSCVYTGTLQSLCSNNGMLDVGRFANLALTPPRHALSQVSAMAPVVIEIYDAATRMQLGGAYDPTSFLEAISAPSSASRAVGHRFATQQLSRSTTYANASGAESCANALAAYEMFISYTTEGEKRIVKPKNATVRLYVTDIVSPSATNQYEQFSSVRFVADGQPMQGDTPQRVGNPGYVSGSIINAGQLVEDTATGKTAILARRSGFSLPAGRMCSDKNFIPVAFGHSVASSTCAIRLTEAQLRSICASSTGTEDLLKEALDPTLPGFPKGNNSWLIDRLAKFGNSAAASVNDWVTIKDMPWSAALSSTTSGATADTYDPVMHRCSGLVTGIHWVIGVSQAGKASNPQDVIVGATAFPTTGSWSFRTPSGTASATDTTLVRFTFKVSFVEVIPDDERKDILPPPLFTVDDKVFYPFRSP